MYGKEDCTTTTTCGRQNHTYVVKFHYCKVIVDSCNVRNKRSTRKQIHDGKMLPRPGYFQNRQQLDAVIVVDADDLSPNYLLAWQVLSAIWSIARHYSSQSLTQQYSSTPGSKTSLCSDPYAINTPAPPRERHATVGASGGTGRPHYYPAAPNCLLQSTCRQSFLCS